MNQRDESVAEQSDGIGVIKSIVCTYCRNRLRQRCIEECAPQGLYRNLEPRELAHYESPPRVERMASILECAPITRLALMTLVLHYLTEDFNRMARSVSRLADRLDS